MAVPDLSSDNEPQTLREVLSRSGSVWGERAAILAPGAKLLTYAALQQQVADTRRRLQALGLGRGDRVALALPNGPEAAVAFVAIAAAVACAPLNVGSREPEFEFAFSDFRVQAVIVPAGADTPAREAAGQLKVPVLDLHPLPDVGAGAFELTGTSCGPVRDTSPVEAADIALVLHTSGTTARPKIVPLTQRNLTASMCRVARGLELTPGDRCLNVMPLFHVHGLVGALLSSLLSGASVACTEGYSPSRFFEWLAEFKPTWYTAVPTIHQNVLTAARRYSAAIGQYPLRFVRSCSAALPPTVLDGLERTFRCPVVEAYGMTETAHLMAGNPLPPRERKPGSVGLPAGCELGIMDADARLLNAGEVGEVVARGPMVTSGYEGNPQVVASAFHGDWLRTGDQGYRDADGYYYLTGRLKELINRGGEKIAPREVDEALLQHPAVAAAAAFAVPDATWGEDLAAAVVLHPGAQALAEDIVEFVAARLVDFKVPREVLILDALPLGPTGKVQRIGMSERLGLTGASGVAAAPAAGRMAPADAELEAQVQDILVGFWRELLEVPAVAAEASFFDLGGDSLKATRLAARLRATLDIEVSLQELIEAHTLAAQAALLATLIETRGA